MISCESLFVSPNAPLTQDTVVGGVVLLLLLQGKGTFAKSYSATLTEDNVLGRGRFSGTWKYTCAHTHTLTITERYSQRLILR